MTRLPTFSKENGEKLRAAMSKWPLRGEEKIVLVDLRNNQGGDMVPQALTRWVTRKQLVDSVQIRRTLNTSCLYHALRWGYGNVRPLPEKISSQLTKQYQTHLDRLFKNDGPCRRGHTVTAGKPMTPRTFEPSGSIPKLRIIGLVNQQFGSDCEAMAMVISRLSNGLPIGTNTYGVMQFVQPGYFVLPNTRVMGRIALGTLDAYGDCRSMDGYGMGVDILLTTQAEHSVDGIEQLMKMLLRHL